MTSLVGEAYFDHFDRFLGNITQRKIFQQNENSPAIQILEYDHVFEGCRTCCSFGLSHYVDQIGGIFEVTMTTDNGWDVVPTVLANSLFYCVQNELPQGQGTSVGGIDKINPKFVEGFGKSAVYFSIPYAYPQGFNQLVINDSMGTWFCKECSLRNEKSCFLERWESKDSKRCWNCIKLILFVSLETIGGVN